MEVITCHYVSLNYIAKFNVADGKREVLYVYMQGVNNNAVIVLHLHKRSYQLQWLVELF